MGTLRFVIPVVFLGLVFLAACDPEAPNNISPDLPLTLISFTPSPDKALLHVGDSLVFEAYQGRTLSNGIQINTGSVSIPIGITYDSVAPPDFKPIILARDNEHFSCNVMNGNVRRNTGDPNIIIGFQSSLIDTQFAFKYKFNFLKAGCYCFQLQADYLTSDKGNGYAEARFNTLSPNWYLTAWVDTPSLGTSDYFRTFIVKVEE